jgi:hypothetical protein
VSGDVINYYGVHRIETHVRHCTSHAIEQNSSTFALQTFFHCDLAKPCEGGDDTKHIIDFANYDVFFTISRVFSECFRRAKD